MVAVLSDSNRILLELQRSVGQLTQSVSAFTEESRDSRKKLDRLSHTVYAAGTVGTVLLAIGVWFLDKLALAATACFSAHK